MAVHLLVYSYNIPEVVLSTSVCLVIQFVSNLSDVDCNLLYI